jgi:hypothetical protein
MSLTPEQKTTVATWVAAGDNLSAVQKKLLEHFKLTLTYRDVRFLVDDLELTLKDPAPKADVSDVSKSTPAQKPAAAPAAAAAEPTELPPDDGSEFPEGDEADLPPEDAADLPPADPAAPSTVTVVVDKVTLIPGAIAGGSVTFSDGVTGKWIIDQQYRPGFTEISQPGYRPSPADAQAFMKELGRAMQSRGF